MPYVVTVVIQLDAFRNDYINEGNTPFLYFLEKSSLYGSLIPTFGFEPDAAYLAGLYPDECDGGMHFWFGPDSSAFKIARYLPGFLDSMPYALQLAVRRLIKVYVKSTTQFSRIKYVPHSGRIPFKLLPYFDVAEKHLFIEDEFVEGRGIFSLLKRFNKSFFFHGAPTHCTNTEAVLKGVTEADHHYDFIFLHISDLDSVGHRYGPQSTEIAGALNKIDNILKKIWEHLNSICQVVNLVLFGDHGMVEVKCLFNIGIELEKMDLKVGKDYLYFLDSTLARFWCFNEKAKIVIENHFQQVKQGHILTQEEKDIYHLNYTHDRFGNINYLADPGVLIFPNFWNNSSPEKGMHGYAPEYLGQQSCIMIKSPKADKIKSINKRVDMRRVFPTLLDLLGLPVPDVIELKTLLE